jgi:hypothetical protein
MTSARPPYGFDNKAQVVVVGVWMLSMTADLDSSFGPCPRAHFLQALNRILKDVELKGAVRARAAYKFGHPIENALVPLSQ